MLQTAKKSLLRAFPMPSACPSRVAHLNFSTAIDLVARSFFLEAHMKAGRLNRRAWDLGSKPFADVFFHEAVNRPGAGELFANNVT